MRKLLALLAAVMFSLPAAHARAAYADAELDQLLAPVALYPDALLTQVLMASTYPLEVVEAARWSRAHAGLVGDEAVRAAADRGWDPSVTSLLAFPHLLTRLDEQLVWTRQLGEAFLAQEADVWDAVQRLRRRAYAAGHLLGDERVRVIDDGSTLVIEYADPRVVYVPYYDPWVVYGGWGWSAYPPVVWAPWPGYGYVRSGIWWGTGIGVTVGFFFAAVDWPHRHVKVVHVHNHYVRRHAVPHARRPIHVGRWRHAPSRPRAIRPAHPMPPALSASPSAPRRGSQIERGPRRAVPYDRAHGRPGRTVDRPDRGRRARANAPQYRAAQPHGLARHPRRDARAVPVRPAVRFGVARDRPRRSR